MVLSPEVFFALPIVCLAFLNQTNIHGVVDEMEKPTPRRVSYLIRSSTALSTSFYVVVGVLGYMRFGSLTRDNVLLGYTNLDWTNTVFFSTGRISMAVSLVLSVPLIIYPCRLCVHTLLKENLPKGFLRKCSPNFYFNGETFAIVGVAYCISVLLPEIRVAFGLTGAVTGCALVYILPPSFYLRISGEHVCDSWMSFMSWVLLIIGVLMSVACTSAITYQLVTSTQSGGGSESDLSFTFLFS